MKKYNPGVCLKHIEEMRDRLCYCDTNLQYITRLKSLKMWLDRFSDSLSPQEAEKGPLAKDYEHLFYTCVGFSYYDRINNSILDYNYGNKPFNKK